MFSIIICSYGFCQEVTSVIDKDLQDELSISKKGDLISINIILKAQYDPSELRLKADVFSNRKAKRAFVINELQDYAKSTQIGVLESLNTLKGMDEVQGITSHWLCNVINCKATADAINEIAANPDVLIIGYNKEQHCLFGDETAKPASGSNKEITQNIYQVNADDVWALGYTGEDVIVAVVDTGVNYNHQDLADHLWSSDPNYPHHGYDCYNNDNDPMDDFGHGTHCAGTICGDGTAGSQTGMAPNATLMCVKVLNSSGNGSIDQICSGVEFAVAHGADLFSMSLGFGGGGTTAERVQFRTVMVNTLAAGIPGAVAAGNEGNSLYQYPVPNNVRVPGNCPPPWLNPDQTVTGGISCVICIGAVDYNDAAAYFTSHGPVTWQSVPGFLDYPYNPGIGLIRPDVCAPGVDIKSLDYSGTSGYTLMSGTSMATPCTAGVISLMLSKNHDLTPEEIDEILETTAVKLSQTKDNIFGSGRIDALAAVNEVTNGPVNFASCTVNDAQGNNDGLLNPGETANLNVTMQNIAEYPVHNAVVTLSSKSSYVTINDSIAEYGNFGVGQSITVNNAFSVSLAPNTPIGEKIGFTVTVTSDTATCKNNFKIEAYDYSLDFANVSIYDAETGNGNGMLDPGETADICVYIKNSGNEAAAGVTGVLSTTSPYLTINTNNITYGTFGDGQTKFARFQATLSESVPGNNYSNPLSLILTDNKGRTTQRNFTYTNKCNVVFNLHDSGGDGWEGAYLYVHYNDGTPTDTLTVPSGNSNYSRTMAINYTTTVSLTWRVGGDDNECTFDISYESGNLIYSTCCSHAGVFYSWVNNCTGSISHICHSPENLEATVAAHNVILSWTVPSREALTGYNVYRNDVLIASNVTTTTYTDRNLENGIYTYSVEAVYDDGCISEPSDYISVEVSDQSVQGDANGDGYVNINDIMITVSYIFNNNPSQFIFDNADVNGDGSIDVRDIIGIATIISNN